MTRPESETYILKLYVAGLSPRSCQAVENFNAICRKYLKNWCETEVVDVLQNPKQARTAQIVALPTLVKESPGQVKRMVGTLSDTARVLAGLDLRPDQEETSN